MTTQQPLENMLHDIRKKALKRVDKKPPRELAASWSGDDLLYSGPGRTIFIVLPTPGCAWALSGSGGCSMCSYIADSPLEEVSTEELVEIFKQQLQRQIENQELAGPTAIKIFVSGSFLNEEEIPPQARQEIFRIINAYDDVEEVVVESRPEYVTEDIIRDCCQLIPEKIFEVAMGLESASDEIRLSRINKGFTREDFENAMQIINRVKSDFKVQGKVYLLVKPVLTSEKEAIEDGVRSAQYAAEMGVGRIAFCPSTIHKGTLMEVLWRRGSYQPPWIWSTLEIIRRVRESIEIPVIMDTAGFGTRRGPYNCKKCNSKLKNLIIESNIDQTIPPEIECECKPKWEADVKFSEVTRSTTNLVKNR
ncbi:archaeosine biosynthesis radical SAM protein RaSEA [Methanobacterium formicicum]|uniref:archaeosine biosynthesis radical SAM protein RaSEA n=1 Tax=Methanobacterium formicicum TaxID=2162 RepID=UPI0024127EFD|nr:archaeosine biosynthesis radical SAM protein RaSEA [Methanobacterium formicicum]MDG3547985.1 archaeosine biosynthesis radical SAM protein RaSEA [Methanobacterium formicicum]